MKFPKLNNRDKLRLLGFANYMGYVFVYEPGKKKAIMIINGEVYYVQKGPNGLYGVNKNTKEKMAFEGIMRIAYFLNAANIVPMPKEGQTSTEWFRSSGIPKLFAK